MYKELGGDIDISKIKDNEVIQVCIGRYEAILRFTGDLSISIESSCELVDQAGRTHRFSSDSPNETAQLTSLLGDVIVVLEQSGKGNVRIKFHSGLVLTIIDDNRNTESYCISVGDKQVLV